MYPAGDIDMRATRLIEGACEAMMCDSAFVRPGATLGDIGFAIQSYVEAARFSTVRDFCRPGRGDLRPQTSRTVSA